MTDTPRLDARYAGSVSEGTLNPRHLVPRFVEILEQADPRHALVEDFRKLWAAVQIVGQFTQDAPEDVANLLGLWECEAMGWLLEGLFDALNDVAPEGTYFSTAEGDGASYGFWPLDECPECGHSTNKGNPECYYCTPEPGSQATETA